MQRVPHACACLSRGAQVDVGTVRYIVLHKVQQLLLRRGLMSLAWMSQHPFEF